MAKIKILPPEIVSKIAAGEVIERPASVLKELVENSLDAKTSSVEVMLKGAGKNLIKIKDNGIGIAQEDMHALFNRHATSKISCIDDLYNIGSLGFRGEALYSIAAVADIILRSKTALDQAGWQVHLRGHENLKAGPVPMPEGTEIEVAELFFNTPARKKFLKSNTAELNHILDTFIPYTLLYPQARFALTHDTRKIIDVNPVQDHLRRICDILHLDPKHCLQDQREIEQIQLKLHLILGDTNIRRTHKDMQFIFINGRPVLNRTLSFHMNETYRMLFSPGVYPFFCIYISMPAQDLDVNVHPAKREVRLKDEIQIAGILRRCTENLLMAKSQPVQAKFITQPIQKNDLPAGATIVPQAKQEQYNFAIDYKKQDLKQLLSQARYLGNLLQTYLLFESGDSLLIIDQHAAQERIAFEKLKSQIDNSKVEVQRLLSPITISLSSQEIISWQENKEALANLGFETTLFDQETLAIHSHPILISRPEDSIRNLLAGENINRMGHEDLARMACRSSVMAGFAMHKEQAEYQRLALLGCKDPFSCPHGRPTVIELSRDAIAKQFLRT